MADEPRDPRMRPDPPPLLGPPPAVRPDPTAGSSTDPRVVWQRAQQDQQIDLAAQREIEEQVYAAQSIGSREWDVTLGAWAMAGACGLVLGAVIRHYARRPARRSYARRPARRSYARRPARRR